VRAQDIMRDLGFVQDWYVVGGFDNEGKGGCDTDFGPESAPDLKTSYPLEGREVGWRRPAAKSPEGSVDLSVPLRPNDRGGGLRADVAAGDGRDQGAALARHLGRVPAVRERREGGRERPLQPAARRPAPVEVKLRKGFNRVLLKVCQEKGPFGFFVSRREARRRAVVPVQVLDSVPPLEKGSAPVAAEAAHA
jgi:hypothetical protein